MMNWPFNNTPQDKPDEVHYNLPSLPLGLYITIYCCLFTLSLICNVLGLTLGTRMGFVYKILTTAMAFHVFNTFGEHYSWLPEPQTNNYLVGLDKSIL